MASSDLDPVFDEAGKEWNVDPNLLRSVAHVESGGNPNAVSPKGAAGLMQFMPQTVHGLGGFDANNPVQSIWAAAKLLNENINRYGSSADALRAYNAGTNQNNWNNPETNGYVTKVAGAYSQLKQAGSGQQMPQTQKKNDLPGDDDFLSQSGAALKDAPAANENAVPDDHSFLAATGAGASDPAAPPTLLQNIGAGVYAGAQSFPAYINQGIAKIDQAVPVLGAIDRAIGADPAALAARQQAEIDASDAAHKGSLAYGTGRAVGQIAETAPLLAVGGAGVGAAGGALAEGLGGAATVGGRLAQAGTNLLTGTGATNAVGRGLTAVTGGAVAGGANALLTGADPVSGAEYGAALGPATAVAAPFVRSGAAYLGRGANALLNSVAGVEAPAVAAQAGQSIFRAKPNALLAEPQIIEAAPNGVPTSVSEQGQATPPPAGPPASAPPDPASAPPPSASEPAPTDPAPETPPIAPTSQPEQKVPQDLPSPPLAVLTSRQADAHADNIIKYFASNGPTDIAVNPLVADTRKTLSQATGNSGLAALEASLRSADPEFNNMVNAMGSANNAARNTHITNVIGTPADIEAASTARNTATAAAREAAFANPQPVDAAPVLSAIDEQIAAAKGRPLVQKPLTSVRDELLKTGQAGEDGSLTVDPQTLYNVRMHINDLLSPAARSSEASGQAAARELTSLKPAFDDTIEQGAPGFKNYMQQYEQMSRPIDGMSWLQGQGLTDNYGNPTLTKVESTLRALKKAQGKNGVSAADSVTPEQIQKLTALRDEMRQSGFAYSGKPPGSDTFQKLSTNALLRSLGGTDTPTGYGLLGSVGGAIAYPQAGIPALAATAGRYALGAANQRGDKLVLQALRNRLLDPSLSLPPAAATGAVPTP